MKKAIIALSILALVASVATAEVTLGAWGRGVFLPVYNSGVSGEDSKTANVVSWGGAPRIGFTVAGNGESMGFQADMNVDGATVSVGDNQYIWAKPVSMVKVSLGNFYDDTLRNNEGFGAFNWYRGTSIGIGESIAFSRINENRGSQQFEVSVKPNDAIYAAISFVNVGQGNGGMQLQENLFRNVQIAGGYTIAGLGQIKAQYLSTAVVDPSDVTAFVANNSVEVAFKLTKIENLVAEAGFAMFLNDDVQKIDFAGMTGVPVEGVKKIALTANYKMDAVTLHFYNIEKMLKFVGVSDMYTFADLGVGADYALAGGLTVSGDIRYENVFGKDASDVVDPSTSFFAGISKGLSNGKIGVGFEYLSATNSSYAIPVVLEYGF